MESIYGKISSTISSALNGESEYNKVAALKMFDAVTDKTITNTLPDAKGFFAKFATMSYSKPDDSHLVGTDAIAFLNKALTKGIKLSGGEMPFLFLYEMMTRALRLRLLNEDQPFILATLMIRFTPYADWGCPNELMSILRGMAANQKLCDGMPAYKDDRRFKSVTMFQGMGPGSRLVKGVQEKFVQVAKAHSSTGPGNGTTKGGESLPGLETAFVSYEPPATIFAKPFRDLCLEERSWIVPRARDLSCRRRCLVPFTIRCDAPRSADGGGGSGGGATTTTTATLTMADIAAHAGTPLSPVLEARNKPCPPPRRRRRRCGALRGVEEPRGPGNRCPARRCPST